MPKSKKKNPRVPGPPAPTSGFVGTVSQEEQSPFSLDYEARKSLRPRPAVDHLPGVQFPKRNTLMHKALECMAKNWDFVMDEYQNHLATELPAKYKELLLSYIATYGPEKGVTIRGLKLLLRLPPPYEDTPVDNTDIRRLDLAGSIGPHLTLKQLTNLIAPPSLVTKANNDDVADSWEDADDDSSSSNEKTTALRARYPLSSITALSLGYMSPKSYIYVDWPSLEALAAITPKLTYLSLAYWPDPASRSPKSHAAEMVKRGAAGGRPQRLQLLSELVPGIVSLRLDGETRTNHSVWRRAQEEVNAVVDREAERVYEADMMRISAVKRMSKLWYSLEYLDLDCCEGWWDALWGVKSGERVEWKTAWKALNEIQMRELRPLEWRNEADVTEFKEVLKSAGRKVEILLMDQEEVERRSRERNRRGLW
jgi:hypothetical protein